MSLLAQNIDFDKFNPLIIERNADPSNAAIGGKIARFSTPGGIISEALTFLFPAAGLILFVMIVWGGFEMLSGAASAKSKDAGRQRITAAIIGFILLFAAYWIAQILEVVFGISILK